MLVAWSYYSSYITQCVAGRVSCYLYAAVFWRTPYPPSSPRRWRRPPPRRSWSSASRSSSYPGIQYTWSYGYIVLEPARILTILQGHKDTETLNLLNSSNFPSLFSLPELSSWKMRWLEAKLLLPSAKDTTYQVKKSPFRYKYCMSTKS